MDFVLYLKGKQSTFRETNQKIKNEKNLSILLCTLLAHFDYSRKHCERNQENNTAPIIFI